MLPNPLLRELGFSDTDRVLILHADDIGFCHASFAALDGLLDAGIVSSLATMVVCPWFPAVAAHARARKGVDLGVHITLNCEYDTSRWGPVSACGRSSGLIDKEGYLPRTSAAVWKDAMPAAVAAELTAQIRRAVAAGLDPTHVDSHMGTVWHPKFLPDYMRISARFRLPAFFPRMDAQAAAAWGHGKRAAAVLVRRTAAYLAKGWPLFDHIAIMPLDRSADRIAEAKRLLSALPAGLTYFILHPAVDSAELRAVTPDWRSRAADYQAFTSPELRDFIRSSGLQVIGWRVIRDWMRRKK
jgi:predicted glycoside hydrolase/deacetylase ChbG (UPF0249 family)